MSSTRDFVICHDGRIVPVPSGVYVHNRPVSEPIDVLALAAALVTEPIPGVVMVHPAPGAERAVILLRYLRGLPVRVRALLGVKPPQNVLDNPDVAGLEELSDLYDAALILPVLEVLRGSTRAMPMNAEGHETSWGDAVSVRLLTRVQAADRESVLEAVRVVGSGQPPSLQRWQDWSSRTMNVRDAFHVPSMSGALPAGTVQSAFGAYLARYLSAGAVFADVPQTVEALQDVIGGGFESLPVTHSEGLVAGSAVLLSYRQAGSREDGVAWLFAGPDGQVRLDPAVDDAMAGRPGNVERWVTAVLADSSTRVLAVDATGAPVALADVLARTDTSPERPSLPGILRTGGTVFAEPGLSPFPMNNDVIVHMALIDEVTVASVGERAQAVLDALPAGEFAAMRVRLLLQGATAADREYRPGGPQAAPSDRATALDRVVAAAEAEMARRGLVPGPVEAPAPQAGAARPVGEVSSVVGEVPRPVGEVSAAVGEVSFPVREVSGPVGEAAVGAAPASEAGLGDLSPLRLNADVERLVLLGELPESQAEEVRVAPELLERWRSELVSISQADGGGQLAGDELEAVRVLLDDVATVMTLPESLDDDFDRIADLLATLMTGTADHGLVVIHPDGGESSGKRTPEQLNLRAMILLAWLQDRFAAPRSLYGLDQWGRQAGLALDVNTATHGREAGSEGSLTGLAVDAPATRPDGEDIDDSPVDPRVSLRHWFEHLTLADLRRLGLLLNPRDTQLLGWTATLLALATPVHEALGATSRSQEAERNRDPAIAGYTAAMNYLGLMLRDAGRPEQAQVWMERAAEAGHTEAMVALGVLLWGQQDLGRAQHWLERAAEAGHVTAKFNLGVLFEGQQDLEQAQIWFERAAEGGSAKAMNSLGSLFDDRQDPERAQYWYEQAGAAGHVGAMFNLGDLFEQRQEWEAAERWYERAAEAADAEAMVRLALLLVQRHGLQAARDVHENLVAAGPIALMFTLGNLFARGQELERAQRWYGRAVDAGHTYLRPDLESLLDWPEELEADQWLARSARTADQARQLVDALVDPAARRGVAEQVYSEATARHNADLIREGYLLPGDLPAQERAGIVELEAWRSGLGGADVPDGVTSDAIRYVTLFIEQTERALVFAGRMGSGPATAGVTRVGPPLMAGPSAPVAGADQPVPEDGTPELTAARLAVQVFTEDTRILDDDGAVTGRNWTGGEIDELDLASYYVNDGTGSSFVSGPWRSDPFAVVPAGGDHDHLELRLPGGDQHRVSRQVFEHLLALDPDLGARPAGDEVVLVWSGAGDRNPRQPRAAAARVGRNVWAYSGPLSLDGYGAIEVGHRGAEGVSMGSWLLSEPHLWQPDPGVEPAVRTLHDEMVPDSQVQTRSITRNHRSVGFSSFPPDEHAWREAYLREVPRIRELAQLDPLTNRITLMPAPWADQDAYFMVMHGDVNLLSLAGTDGARKPVDGTEGSRFLKRRNSIQNLNADEPIVIIGCLVGAVGPGHGSTGRNEAAPDPYVADPLGLLSAAQVIANENRRTVYAMTRLAIPLRLTDGRYVHGVSMAATGASKSGGVVELRPEPAGPVLVELARTAGLHGEGQAPAEDLETVRRLVNALRLTFGAAVEQDAGFDAMLRGIGALELMRREDAGLATVGGPFTLDLLDHVVRQRSGSPGSHRPTADEVRSVLTDAAAARAAGRSLREFVELPGIDLPLDLLSPNSLAELGVDGTAVARRVLRLPADAPLTTEDRQHFVWSLVRMNEVLDAAADPDALAVRVLHLSGWTTQVGEDDAMELGWLIAGAAAAGRNAFDPVALAAFHLEQLGALSEASLITTVDGNGEVVGRGRDWTGATSSGPRATIGLDLLDVDQGGSWALAGDDETSPQRRPFPVIARGGPAYLDLHLPEVGWTRVPAEEVGEVLKHDPYLIGEDHRRPVSMLVLDVGTENAAVLDAVVARSATARTVYWPRLPFTIEPDADGTRRIRFPSAGSTGAAPRWGITQPPAPAGSDSAHGQISGPARSGNDSLRVARVEVPLPDWFSVPRISPPKTLPAPAGKEWVDGVLTLGEVSQERQAEVADWVQGTPRSAVLVGPTVGEAERKEVVDDLIQVLRWAAYAGAQPVVHVLQGAQFPALRDVLHEARDTLKPVTIERTTVGMDDRWGLFGSDGSQLVTADQVTAQLFAHAGWLPVVDVEHQLPSVLLDWLALTDPAAIERYLRAHLGELDSPELVERLGRVPFEDAGVQRTMLNLVLRNGGAADPGAVRFAPVEDVDRSVVAPLQVVGRVSEAFVVDYLRPQRSLEQRKAWNDQLVRLVDVRSPEEIARTGVQGLAVEEMWALASNTRDEVPGESDAQLSRGLATVFTGLMKVLRMSQEKVTGPVVESQEWLDLVMPIATCDLSPVARQIIVYQFGVVEGRLVEAGRGDHAGLVQLVTASVGICN